MVAVGAVQKCDKSRSVDVALSLCGHRRDRRWTGWNLDLRSPPDPRISSTDFAPNSEAPRGRPDGQTQPLKCPKLARVSSPDGTRAHRGLSESESCYHHPLSMITQHPVSVS